MAQGGRGGLARVLVAFALALLVALGPSAGRTAPPPAPPPAPSGTVPATGDPLPSQGAYQLGKVRILGVPVITVASPVLGDSGDGPDATTRARVIEGNLEMLYRGRYTCSSGEALAELLVRSMLLRGKEKEEDAACGMAQSALSGRPDAVSVDVVRGEAGVHRLEARVAGRAQPLPLLTVTPEDAHLNGLDNAALAARWQQILERRLRLARQLLQPRALLSRWGHLALVEAALLAALALSLWWWRGLRHMTARWEERYAPGERSWRRSLAVQGLHTLSFSMLLAASALALMVVGVALLAVPGEVPTALELLLQPWGIAVKVLLVGLLNRLVVAGVGLWLRQWVGQVGVPGPLRDRRRQRCKSLRHVLRRLVGLACLLLATVWVLSGVPGVRELSDRVVLLGGALLGGLAIVFQGLLRDFVAGLAILQGDAFAIGDTVEIEGLVGEVTDLGLLATELRCADQRAASLPNSRCAAVVNHTKLRSGVEVTMTLSPRCGDLRRALAVISQELEAFAADPAWEPSLEGKPEPRGVTAAGPAGITVTVLVVTVPGAQSSVGREVRLRLLERLRRESIPLAESSTEPP